MIVQPPCATPVDSIFHFCSNLIVSSFAIAARYKRKKKHEFKSSVVVIGGAFSNASR